MTDAAPAKPPSFWLPDNLRPPALADFWPRYLLMGVLLAAWEVVLLSTSLWFWWNSDNGTVGTFGIVWQWPGGAATTPEAAAEFEQFVNAALRGATGTVCLLFVLAVACAYGWRRLREQLAGTPWRKVAGYGAAGAAIFILADWAFESVGAYSGDPSLQRKPSLDLFLVSLGAIGIVGPVAEEVAVRFTLFQFLRTKLSFALSALISSAIFGLMHFGYPDPMKMLMTLGAGWILAWSYELTGSILAPVLVHVLNNCFMQTMRFL